MIFLRLFSGCILQLIPFAFLCFYPFLDCFRLTKKKTIFITMLLLFGISLIFAGIGTTLAAVMQGNHFLFQMVNVVFILCLIPCFAWYIYAVKAIWQTKLFLLSFTLTCALSITSICNCITTYIYMDAPPSDGLPYRGYAVLIILLITVAVLPLLWLFLKYCFLPISDALSAKESGYLAFLSLLLLIILASGLSFIAYSYLFENPMTLFLFIALLIAVFITYIVIFRMYRLIHEKYISQKKYILMKHQVELRDEQYHRFNENILATRQMRHDIKHHFLTLQGFLTEGNFTKAETYLNEYLDTTKNYEIMNLCSHPIVNMTVSHYYALAKENQIDFAIRIHIPKELPIQDSDISVLLGNLLENAVTAATSAPDGQRNIQLNMIVSRKTLVIAVDNGFNGTVSYENGEYLSTKPEHNGLGVKSITNIAEKYGGGVEFTHEDMVFHSSVMLEFAKDDA